MWVSVTKVNYQEPNNPIDILAQEYVRFLKMLTPIISGKIYAQRDI